MTDDMPGPLASLRVIVAEDELMTMMLLEDMLEELGATVVASVKTPDDVITAADKHHPNAVTLDVNLGGELAYRAAQGLQKRGIPFVFVSGYGSFPDCPPELHDQPRLKKPFRLDELLAVMQTALAAAT